VAEGGLDSLEWLLKRLTALAELTHKLVKKLWALWFGLGSPAFADHSGQAQAALGTEFKVMQESLRHSSLRSTLDAYTQAISPAKHAAQAAVLALVFAFETSSIAVA
jgi:hypothetical protein